MDGATFVGIMACIAFLAIGNWGAYLLKAHQAVLIIHRQELDSINARLEIERGIALELSRRLIALEEHGRG